MQRKSAILLSVTSIIFVVILFHYIGWLSLPEKWVRSLINTPSSYIFKTTNAVQGTQTFVSSKKELSERIQALESQIGSLSVDQSKLALLEDENKRLREQLNFITTSSIHSVGAEAIGRSIDPIATTIIINRGERDGIREGNPVIIGSGILVGKVISVHEASAIVQLINDTQSRVAATVLNNKEHSLGIVEGGFGIAVRLKFIPQNEEIRGGDIITTSGLEGNIPRGLLIGTIEAVERKPQEPFQEALLKPIYNLNDITVVSVLLTE